MRKWLLAVVLLTALVVAVALFAALRFNSYLNDNRALIAEQASQALGRKVDFGGVRVSLSGGVGIRLTGSAAVCILDGARENLGSVVKLLIPLLVLG